jgi:hypothetical protein
LLTAFERVLRRARARFRCRRLRLHRSTQRSYARPRKDGRSHSPLPDKVKNRRRCAAPCTGNFAPCAVRVVRFAVPHFEGTTARYPGAASCLFTSSCPLPESMTEGTVACPETGPCTEAIGAGSGSDNSHLSGQGRGRPRDRRSCGGVKVRKFAKHNAVKTYAAHPMIVIGTIDAYTPADSKLDV